MFKIKTTTLLVGTIDNTKAPKHLYKPPPIEGKIIPSSPIDTLDFLLFSASLDAIFGLKQSLFSLPRSQRFRSTHGDFPDIAPSDRTFSGAQARP